MVQRAWLETAPIFKTSGVVSDGARPSGTTALICNSPAISNGAAPAYLSSAFVLPIITDKFCAGAAYGAVARLPSAHGGLVSPPPVASNTTIDSGFA